MTFVNTNFKKLNQKNITNACKIRGDNVLYSYKYD